MRIIDVTMSLDSITDTGNTTTNTIETGDITIKNQNGSNPVDAGSLYFVETGTTWATNIYGFRFNQVGDTNKLQLQSGNLTTVKNLLTFERDSGDVGIGEAVTPVATLHISSSGNDSTTDALFIENGEGTDLFNIDNTGSVSMLQYGSGDRTGTAAYALSVDSSGNIIETTAASGTPTLQQVTDEDNSLTTQITTSAAIVTSAFPAIYSDGNLYITPKTYGAHTASISGFHGVEFQNNSYVRFKDFTGATKALISSAGQAAFGTGSLFSSPPQLHTAGNQSVDPFRATLKTNTTTEVDVFEVDNRGVIKSFFSGSEIGNWSGSIAIVGFDDDPILGDGLTILGGGALTNTTPSYGTTIVGAHAGSSMTNPGFGIVGIGAYALSGVDGSYHTGIGYRAGQDSDGTGNISLGFGAGQNVTGSYNLSLGWKAGQKVINQGAGEGNVYVGYQAGMETNGTSDYNILIGYNTGYSASFLQGNNTIIGGNLFNSSTETINNTVVIGSYNQERLRISSAGLYTFNSYGSGTHTGTTAYNLAVDSSGNVIEVSPISSPVDGSGTANYVSKWVDTDTLTDSQIFDNGTNVGINTAFPNYTLDVNGNINGTSLYLGSSIIHEGDTNTKIEFDTDTINFDTAGSQRMQIASDGDIYVGSSTEGIKFSIEGTNVYRVDGIDTGGSSWNSLHFRADSENGLFIEKDTNQIGIGTTAPNHALDIYSNTSIPFRIHRPSNANLNTTGSWGIGFSTRGDDATSTTDTRAGIFAFYNGGLFMATDTADVYTDPASKARLTVLNDGNVGIGTISPARELEITGTGNVYARISAPTDNDSAALELNNTQEMWTIQNDDTIDDALRFKTSVGTRMVIEKDGNVGIGTTSPSTELEVNGEIKSDKDANGVSFSATGGPSTFTAYDVYTATNGGLLRLYDASNQTVNIDGRSSSGVSYINNGGNFGINTTSPSEKLHVNGTILSDAEFILGRSATTDATTKSFRLGITHYTNAEEPFVPVMGTSTSTTNIAFVGGGTSIGNAATQISFYTAANNTTLTGTERMTINSSGNVGIGTTTPSEKLDVDGNIQISGSNLSYQFATGVTTTSTIIASYPSADCDCVFFDYVIKTQTGTNLRAGTVMAVHDGTNVEYTETSTNDIGDTSAFVFVVNILSGNVRLLGSATTGTYDIKTLVRTI